jgi:hypothetical protein
MEERPHSAGMGDLYLLDMADKDFRRPRDGGVGVPERAAQIAASHCYHGAKEIRGAPQMADAAGALQVIEERLGFGEMAGQGKLASFVNDVSACPCIASIYPAGNHESAAHDRRQGGRELRCCNGGTEGTYCNKGAATNH